MSAHHCHVLLFLFFDLPLSCLVLAEDEANPLEMICARQVVLAAYGLHQDEASLFVKNMGRITPSTYLFEELVLVHVASQLNRLLNQLLEKYVGLVMHKRCRQSDNCWDNNGDGNDSNAFGSQGPGASPWRFLSLLDRLRRTLHGWLTKGGISNCLQGNLTAVIPLLLCFESALGRPQSGQCRVKPRSAKAANDMMTVLWLNSQLSRHLVPFCQIVPSFQGPGNWQDLVTSNLLGDQMANFETWWKNLRVFADRMFAALTFYILEIVPMPEERV